LAEEERGRICAVVAEDSTARAIDALRQASEIADLVEVRLDYLRDFNFGNLDALGRLLEGKQIPVIITCRSISEGGKQRIDDAIRLPLLVEGARRYADFCDVEADSYARVAELSPDLSKLIVSYHNFAETPIELESVYDQITSLPAAVYKIVTKSASTEDSLSTFRLLARASADGRRLIALTMGETGLITRVLSPSRGGFLTYGALQGRGQTAPGQPTCDDLVAHYRVRTLSRRTLVVGIVGRPVGHSASPAMHNAAFADLALDCVYLPFEVTDIESFFKRFVRPSTREIDWRLGGLSVTIPYKSDVIALLDEVDETAKAIGAVNTVVLDGEKLRGLNTDAQGAVAPLESIYPLKGLSCAVIGAGGAARAVVYGLLQKGARVTIFARNPEKAQQVGEDFDVEVRSTLDLRNSNAEVLINTTPVGLAGHSQADSPVPREFLRDRKMVYDLVYNPVDTRLLKEAREEGCQTLNGLAMLVAQGAAQFELWTGNMAPLATMTRAALNHLQPDGKTAN
jgi:3-dehydroquinate dehydratase/shikimate dehydrogenase